MQFGEVGAMQEHEIILYQLENTNVYVNVIFIEETFWMTQRATAELFDYTTDNISLHLKNIYKEELDDELLERIREIRASERRAYQKITDIFEQCSYDYDKSSEITKNFYAFVQNYKWKNTNCN